MNIPDEVFAAAVKMAMNRGISTANDNHKQNYTGIAETMEKALAKRAKALLDTLCDEGFTQEQAFDLVKVIFAGRRD